MHDRSDIRRSRCIADAMGILGGVLAAAGTMVALTTTHRSGAVVGGVVVLTAGLALLALASLGWERATARSAPMPRTAVRWGTSPRPVVPGGLVPLALGRASGTARRRVVSLPYAELPAARP